MGLFRRAINEDFIIVAISSGLTMEAENNAVIVRTIEAARPSYWQMMNPDGYTVFFKSPEAESRSRAYSLSSKVQTLITTDGRFADFKVGMAEGRLVTEVNWRGKVCFPPVGGAVNAAYRNQKGRQDLQNPPSDATR